MTSILVGPDQAPPRSKEHQHHGDTSADGGTATPVVPRQRQHPSSSRTASLLETSHQQRSRALALLPATAFLVDLLAIGLALVVAALGHTGIGVLWGEAAQAYVPSLVVAGPILGLAWLVTIALAGGYDWKVFGSGAAEFNRVLNATLGAAGLVGVSAFVLASSLSRSWYVLTFVIGLPLVLLGRSALRAWTKRLRARGLLQRRVVIIGDALHVASIASVLGRESWLGYRVVGAIAPASEDRAAAAGIPFLGDTRDAAEIALAAHADILVFASGGVSSPQEMRSIAWQLEGTSVQTVVAPSVSDVSAERVSMRPVGGLPLIHLEHPRTARAARRAKRGFDLAGALFLLLVASPLIGYAALRVKWHDGGTVLFRQERIGRDGRPFDCLKFRTMVTDAEAHLHQVHEQQGSDADAVFYKLRNDPRITRPGRWLRRYSIDEVPQLVNVLRGEMSLVGPRPQVAHEVALYEAATSRRLRVRPGLTGLWQVSGRSDLPAEEAVRLDLYYVDNWSMLQDLAILARTASAVLSSRGAY